MAPATKGGRPGKIDGALVSGMRMLPHSRVLAQLPEETVYFLCSPQNIELALSSSKFIEYVAVIGDRRKFLSALVIPDFVELEKWAKKKGIVYSGRKDMTGHSEVRALFEHEIESIMKDFARVEQIRRFTLLDDVWSIDSGELTGSLKVKRRIVEAKYAAVIDAMYVE